MYHHLKIDKQPNQAVLQRLPPFLFFNVAFQVSTATANRWLHPQKQHLTDDQVQPRTSREITEQLQMAMTVTHPSLRCLFHPQSLLNPLLYPLTPTPPPSPSHS